MIKRHYKLMRPAASSKMLAVENLRTFTASFKGNGYGRRSLLSLVLLSTASAASNASDSRTTLLQVPRGVIYGCGDLIFSSHMIFTLVFVRVYHKYGSKRCIKALAWLMAIIQSLLIIASRKHYSVDVVVAWIFNYWTNWKGVC